MPYIAMQSPLLAKDFFTFLTVLKGIQIFNLTKAKTIY